MTDQPPVTVTSGDVGALRYTPARDLTPGEERALEQKAQYRGALGRLRHAVRDALEQIPEGTNGRSILERALEDKADG